MGGIIITQTTISLCGTPLSRSLFSNFAISQTHTRYAFQNRATCGRSESSPSLESFFAL